MATSVHQDILTLAKTRLAALSLGGSDDRIEEREAVAQGWMAGIAAYPLWVVSGYGVRTWLDSGSCTDDYAYPLAIMLVDREPTWSIEERDTHLGYLQTVIDAFHHKRLTLTYSGAHCLDVLLLPSLTIEPVDTAWQTVKRQLLFEVRVRQQRT